MELEAQQQQRVDGGDPNPNANANAVSVSLSNGVNGSTDDGNRAPRLPRWTRQEILVLIQGKMVAENRVRKGRTGGGGGGSAFGSSNQVEPKWTSVSSYCKRHGVNRGPVQCRKRWSNLAGDFRKIKEWESQISEESESFWGMRNDLRREKKLPGFFDREVYDVLDGGTTVTATEMPVVVVTALPAETPKEVTVKEEEVEAEADVEVEEETVFDSGRSAAANDGLFEETPVINVQAPLPISEKQYEPVRNKGLSPDQGVVNEKQPAPASNPDKGSTSQEGRKRRRLSSDEGGGNSIEDQLIKVLERNSRMLTTQLEAQNTNFQMDRDQRKDQSDSVVAVLGKLADALGRIADKL